MAKPSEEDLNNLSQVPILASIGHVCLRWSLLEMTVLAVINQLELISSEKGALLYGGLDILPRFKLAIRLAEYHRLPRDLTNELKEIRKAVQKDVAERRNQAVHGAHSDADVLEAVNLTMVRWPEPKRTETVSLEDLIALTEEIHDLQVRTYRVFEEVHKWQTG